MSKRSATDALTEGQPYPKASGSGQKRDPSAINEEMGEFEDNWEDEIDDSEEEIVDAEAGQDEDGRFPI